MYLLAAILIVTLTIVDQLTKFLVVKNIHLGEVINVIKFGDNPVFSLTHVRNKGAAWSSFSDKTSLLTIFTFIIIVFFLVVMFVKPVQKKLLGKYIGIFETISFSLIISGGIGNLIDRFRLKEVVDFIKADFIDFPIFNFADICVVIGCILFVADILISDINLSKKPEKTNE